jgi:hypothetical protein
MELPNLSTAARKNAAQTVPTASIDKATTKLQERRRYYKRKKTLVGKAKEMPERGQADVLLMIRRLGKYTVFSSIPRHLWPSMSELVSFFCIDMISTKVLRKSITLFQHLSTAKTLPDVLGLYRIP